MGQFMKFHCTLRIIVWLCMYTLVVVLPSGNHAAPTSASVVEASPSAVASPTTVATLSDVGTTPGHHHQTSVTPSSATMTTMSARPLEMGEEMVTPAALMELLPHEKQQQKEQLLKQQEMLERLRLENEKKLWEEREALRVAYALENSSEEDDTTTEPTLRTTQQSTTVKTVTLPGGKKKRPENPILKKFKISNSRGIMVFRSAPTTPRVITTTKVRITTEPATTSTTTSTTTTAMTTNATANEIVKVDEQFKEDEPTSSIPSLTTTTEASTPSIEMLTSTPSSELPLSSTAKVAVTLEPMRVDVKTSTTTELFTESSTTVEPFTTSLPVRLSSISSLPVELESPEVNSIPSQEEDSAEVNAMPSTTLTTAELTQESKATQVNAEDSMEMQNDQPLLYLEDDNSLQTFHAADDLQQKSDALRMSLERDKEALAGEPIDMKYHNAKLMEEAHMVRVNHTDGDGNDGHDGVKNTKKKQLIDKQTESLDVAMGEVNGGEIVPKVVVTEKAQDYEEPSERKSTVVPLKPVRNGFLGPLIMGEKIFSIGKQKQQKPKHETSIESQLKEGRIVEIIAPTALVEDLQTTTTTKLMIEVEPTAAATTLKPSHPSFVSASEEKLSTTVFQVSESLSSTTGLPSTKSTDDNEPTQLLPNSEQTESKISDIQIEVYDSTVDSIVASTNFKDYSHPLEVSPLTGTTKPPASLVTQERFTQYVIDRTDSSTQESNIAPIEMMGGLGKPEPAAIEIHINVSEGISGSVSEDLEFSYPQSDYINENEQRSKSTSSQISLKPFMGADSASAQGEVSPSSGSNNSDDILVVEIIDTGENNTDQSSSSENINPVFTFRSSVDTEEESMLKSSPSRTDELFLADVKKDELAGTSYLHPPPPPPPPPRRPTTIDRDSDTIFYISNTEVKVGESLPPGTDELDRRAQLESQFFPVNYVASTHPNAPTNLYNGGEAEVERQHRYEEDIILSPLRNTADSLKIFRSQPDVVGSDNPSPPLDVTYVGESIMEVEQFPPVGMSGATTLPPQSLTRTGGGMSTDVIIQPAILPEMSIGVPVIGELPPQIELKEIDFMPDEANQLRSGVYESNSIDAVPNSNNNNNNNDVDSDSLQYGGDLIDLGASSSFDGVEGSYPFGDGEYAGLHYVHSHGGSHLRRDELSADIGGSAEANDTLKETLANGTIVANGNDTSPSSSNMSPIAERRINTSTTDASDQVSNATNAVHSEKGDASKEDDWKNTVGLTIGLFFILTPVVVTVSMACALRYLYYKYHRNSPDSTEANDNEAGNHNAGANGHTGESTQPPSPSISEQDKETKPTHPNQNLNPNPKPSNNNISNLDTIDEKSSDAHTDNSKTESKSITDSIETVGGGSVGQHQPQQQQHKLKQKQQLSLLPTSVHGSHRCSNSGGPNGSVTKMTLKNNHLIVETEERNDISRDARETKMTYNGNDKDSIFVVEVSRGIDSKAIPESPISENGDHRFPGLECKIKSAAPLKELASNAEGPIKKHQQVEVHPPPPELQSFGISEDNQRSLHQIEEVEEEHHHHNLPVGQGQGQLEKNCKTGLSQSDLSLTSSTDSNKRYSYGNQELYVIDQPGYEASLPNTFVTASVHVTESQRDDDHKSENGHSLGYYGETDQQTKTTGKENEIKKEESLNDTAKEVSKPQDAENVKEVEEVEQQTQAGDKDLEESEEDIKEQSLVNEAAVVTVIPNDMATEIEAIPAEDVKIESKIEDISIETNIAEVKTNDVDDKVDAAVSTDIADHSSETSVKPLEGQQSVTEATLDREDLGHNESIHISTPEASKDIVPDLDDSEPSTEANETEAGIPPITTEMPEDSSSFVVPDLVRDLQGNHRVDVQVTEDCEPDIDADNAMDSMISLPDPPSTEEIKQFDEDGDQNSLLDTNQLDSLPPPPPPPPTLLCDETSAETDENKPNGYDIEITIPAPASFDNAVTNGNSCVGEVALNGHDDNSNDEEDKVEVERRNGVRTEPEAIKPFETLSNIVEAVDNGNCNGKMMSAPSPLTPPASPTTQSPKTPLQCTTTTMTTATMNGGMPLCKPLLPVAVDVNGS